MLEEAEREEGEEVEDEDKGEHCSLKEGEEGGTTKLEPEASCGLCDMDKKD